MAENPENNIGKFHSARRHSCHGIYDCAMAVQILQLVANVFEVPRTELTAGTRRPSPTAFARQVAMYLAHVVCALTLSEVGRQFGRDRTTVAHACGVVEDQRDDPQLDFMLDHLEGAIKRLALHFDGTGGGHG